MRRCRRMFQYTFSRQKAGKISQTYIRQISERSPFSPRSCTTLIIRLAADGFRTSVEILFINGDNDGEIIDHQQERRRSGSSTYFGEYFVHSSIKNTLDRRLSFHDADLNDRVQERKCSTNSVSSFSLSATNYRARGERKEI